MGDVTTSYRMSVLDGFGRECGMTLILGFLVKMRGKDAYSESDFR